MRLAGFKRRASRLEMNNLLADDHSELGEMLDELFSAFETGDVEKSFAKLDIFWARLAMHIRAEHLHLFPAILSAIAARSKTIENGGSVPSLERAKSAIAQLRLDHDFFMHELAAAVKQMRELRGGSFQKTSQTIAAVRGKIIEISRRLEEHNELEESEVYNWADTLLADAERAALDARMKKELDNLPPRFGNL